jgi:hypothetical protein
MTMILDRQSAAARRRVEAEIVSGLKRFAVDGVLQIPMPAFVMSGSKVRSGASAVPS